MTTPTLSYHRGRARPAVDLDQLVSSRLLVQANSGGGKSRAIRQLLEETNGRVLHLIIDPEGEYATLREKFDYVLAAPKDGDVVATPKTARMLCRRLIELGASTVIDIYDLSLTDRREFVKLFLTELMSLPRSLWRTTIVVIDEAHVFAPQTGDAQSLDMVIALCTQGRKRGFCAVLATQRIAKLHKDAAAELLNKMIGRTGLDVDVKRAGDELGFDKDQRADLKSLAPGEFFVYGPAISNDVQRVRTGNVITSHPEPGKAMLAPPPPREKVKHVLQQLVSLAQEAEEEARTIADLEKRNRELTARNRQLEKGVTARVETKTIVDQAAIDRAVERALAAQRKQHLDDAATRRKSMASVWREVGRIGTDLRATGERLSGCARSISSFFEESSTNSHGPVSVQPARSVHVPVNKTERVNKPRFAAPRLEGDLSRGQQKILNALAELHALGIEAASRTRLGMFAGYNLTGGSGAQHIADLVQLGLIAIPTSGVVELTEAGHAAADATDVPSSLADLHQRVLAKASGGQRRIAEHLIAIHPESISRSALGEAVGYNLTGGSGAQHVADLVNLGAISIPRKGEVVASELLFPEGLA